MIGEQEKQFIGISPAGVEWFAYRKPSETDFEFVKKIEKMQERLASLKARAAGGRQS